MAKQSRQEIRRLYRQRMAELERQGRKVDLILVGDEDWLHRRRGPRNERIENEIKEEGLE